MDVITTTDTVKKKIKNQKLKERRSKKLMNQTNQNVEISSKATCHGIAEAGSYVDLDKSSQVNIAHAEISSNGKGHAITEGDSNVGSAVECILRGSSLEDRAPTNTIENKRTAFKDEFVLESSKGEKVLSDAVKGNTHNETKKRKRKSKRKGGSKIELECMDQEHKDLDISNNGKSCNRAEVGLGIGVVSLVEESPKVDKVLTGIIKEKSQQREKRKRCNSKSRAQEKDVQVILGQENNCLESCISATESSIKDVDLSVEPLLQQSTEVEEVSTEIVKEKQNTEGKQRRKKKSKARNKDGKSVLDEEDKCLKISVDGKSCIAAAETVINGVGSTIESLLHESLKVEEVSTEIAEEKNIPGGKQKRKKKTKARNKDGTFPDLKVSVDRKSCVAAAALGINGVDSTVESLLPESPAVEKVSTEIVQEQRTLEEKHRRKRKPKNRDKDEKVIPCKEDKCLEISVERSGIAGGESGLNGVDSTAVQQLHKSPEVQLQILNEEVKCLKISVDRKSCIAAAEFGIIGVDSTAESLLQESPKVEEVSTEVANKQKTPAESSINGVDSTVVSLLRESLKVEEVSTEFADKQKTPEDNKRRKRKSKDSDKDGKVVLREDDKCLKISADIKSCIAAAESGINGVDSTVESLLQESPKVEEVSTEVADKQKTPEDKKRRKRKSKDSDKDGKVALRKDDKCLKISVDTKSCIAAAESGINGVDSTVESLLKESPKVKEVSTEIADKQKTPEDKKRRKRKSKDSDKDGKVALRKDDKCLKISADTKSCIAAAESGINGVDSTVESLLKESPNVEEVLTEIADKQKTPEDKKRRKRKSKDSDKDGKVVLREDDKCLKISADIKSCIAAAESGINGVDSTVESLLQESPKVEEVSTEVADKQKTPEDKKRRKRKSKDSDKDGKVALRKDDKCLKISADTKSCIAAAESGINGVDSTVESLLQVSPKVGDLTDIAKKQKTPEDKQRRKRKSKDSDKDGKVVLGEDDKCLKISADTKSCIAAAGLGTNGVDSTIESLLQESPKVEEVSTEVTDKQKTPEHKKRRKRKSTDSDKDGKVVLCEDDKCLKISGDTKSCIAAAQLTIKDVELNVESLLQDSAVVDEASTEIVKEKKTPKRKRRGERKLKIRSEDEVLVPGQQDELLVTSIDGTKTDIGTLRIVDSRIECPSDNTPLVSTGKVDLSNDLYQLPQRVVTTSSQRILLILDINGLLADIVMPPPKGRKSDINMLGRAIFKRPYCDDFLNFCFDTFDVAIWSSRTKRVIDKVVDYLLGTRRQELLFCWDVSQTTVSRFKTLENWHKPLVCKTLTSVWEKRDPSLPWEKGYYTESNTLLIDDSPYKALLNPMHTAIFPCSFTYNDLHDNSLGPGGEIRVYLQNLAKADDVRRYVEQHPFGQSAITEKNPSWDFYSKVISSLSPL